MARDEMTAVVFQCPESLAASLDARCTADNLPRAEILRRALSQYLGVEHQPRKAGRPPRYGSAEERTKAASGRAKAARAHVRMLIEQAKLNPGLNHLTKDL